MSPTDLQLLPYTKVDQESKTGFQLETLIAHHWWVISQSECSIYLKTQLVLIYDLNLAFSDSLKIQWLKLGLG